MKSITFSYHRLQVRFFAQADVSLDAWVGAVLRNNFLAQAAAVIDDQGISLFQHLNTLPIAASHPNWQSLQGGFPKALWFDCRDIPAGNRSRTLYANQIYSFTIVLAASFVPLFPQIMEALDQMFQKGFGHPVVPISLMDVTEYDEENRTQLCYQPKVGIVRWPLSPVRLSDFCLATNAPSDATIQLDFMTPINLFRQRVKKTTELSYQDKLNGFPSFYQFMRSLVYRVSTLDLLYGNQPGEGGWSEMEIDQFLQASSLVQLQQANVQSKKVRGTPKQGRNHLYVMEGYQGQLVWQQVSSLYLPLLAFGTGLLVGNQVQYGLGAYTVTIL